MITKRVNVTRQSDKNKHAERGPGDMKRKNSQASCLSRREIRENCNLLDFFSFIEIWKHIFKYITIANYVHIFLTPMWLGCSVGIWKSRVRTSSEHNFLSNYISTMSLIMVYLSSSIGFLVTYIWYNYNMIWLSTYHSGNGWVLYWRLLHCGTCGGHISHGFSLIITLLHVFHCVFSVIRAANRAFRHGMSVFRLLDLAWRCTCSVPLYGHVSHARC